MSSFYLGNPLGLWALLALPVLMWIHSLQQRARRVRVSTLFLLEKVAPLSVEGARPERFRQSMPFWMQVLAVLLLTWMLSEPRWIKAQSEQVIAVVLDTSASMSAFKSVTRKKLGETLPRWASNTRRTWYHLMVSDAAAPPLYSGSDVSALLKAYDEWQPLKAGHDPLRALNVARGLVRNGAGIVVFVTDHSQDLPSDVALLSVARPLDNAGFTGVEVRIEEPEGLSPRLTWRALLRNAGTEVQNREWWVERRAESGAVLSSVRSPVRLEPGRTLVLNGEFSPDVEEAELVISADGFVLDDRVTIVKPRAQVVRVAVKTTGESAVLLRRMLEAMKGVELTDGEADVTAALAGEPTETHAILMGGAASEDAKLDGSPVAAEHHALVRELNWSGLLSHEPEKMPLLETDAALLWRGNRVLAFERRTLNMAGVPVVQLFLNWDLARSNAHRLPAFVVMLHRWLDARREALANERVDNFETGQRLAFVPGGARVVLPDGRESTWTGAVPETPGVFEVFSNGRRLVRGAAQFADARESDLRGCAPGDTTEGLARAAAERASEADPLTSLWALALLGCLLTAWGWGMGKGKA